MAPEVAARLENEPVCVPFSMRVAERLTKSQPKLRPYDFMYGEGPFGCLRLRKAMAQHMNRYTLDRFRPPCLIRANFDFIFPPTHLSPVTVLRYK